MEHITSIQQSSSNNQIGNVDLVGGQSRQSMGGSLSSFGTNIKDEDFIERLEKFSIEDIVEIKISRFLDQVGCIQLENMHELIMSKVEKPLILQILRRVGGNQVQAAKVLGINRNTLRKKIKLYGL